MIFGTHCRKSLYGPNTHTSEQCQLVVRVRVHTDQITVSTMFVSELDHHHLVASTTINMFHCCVQSPCYITLKTLIPAKKIGKHGLENECGYVGICVGLQMTFQNVPNFKITASARITYESTKQTEL